VAVVGVGVGLAERHSTERIESRATRHNRHNDMMFVVVGIIKYMLYICRCVGRKGAIVGSINEEWGRPRKRKGIGGEAGGGWCQKKFIAGKW
jgi:hypothetical protein